MSVALCLVAGAARAIRLASA